MSTTESDVLDFKISLRASNRQRDYRMNLTVSISNWSSNEPSGSSSQALAENETRVQGETGKTQSHTHYKSGQGKLQPTFREGRDNPVITSSSDGQEFFSSGPKENDDDIREIVAL